MHVGITWVTDTAMCAPVIATVAIVRADVGVTGVRQIAPFLYMDLQALSHVHIGYIGGRLTHTHALIDSM